MSIPKLSIACTPYLHTEPLVNQQVKSEFFEYEVKNVANIDECTMRTLTGDFDIGEMSLATFLKVQERDVSLKALPIFSRKVMQQYIFCAEKSDLTSPYDLRGKKVAIPQYWITAGIWHRWLLQNYYHVDPREIIWCPLKEDRISGMSYPADYQLDWQYVGQSPEELLCSGEMDCFFYARKLDNMRGIRYLFPDVLSEQIKFYKNTGIIPITHVLAVKEELLKEYPWIAQEVTQLFDKSKKKALKDLGNTVSLYLPFADIYLQEIESILGAEWNHFGWSNNKHILTTFFQAAKDQCFFEKEMNLEQAFVKYNLMEHLK